MDKFNIFLDKRRIKDDGTYPVKILIKLSSSCSRGIDNISLSLGDWEKLNGKNLRDTRLKQIKKRIEDEKKKVREIIDELEKADCLTQENFFKIYDLDNAKPIVKSKPSKQPRRKETTPSGASPLVILQKTPLPTNKDNSVIQLIPTKPESPIYNEFLKGNKYYREELYLVPKLSERTNSCSLQTLNANITEAGKITSQESIYDIFAELNLPFKNAPNGTFENYQKALESFIKFRPHVKYSELTPQFFNEYEIHMMNTNVKASTVGIYCRAIRRAIKVAIKKGYMDENDYPFGRRKDGKYPIPKGDRTKHRALPDDTLVSFVHYSSDDEDECYAHALTIFSFYCNGMNMRDVFQLQPGNVDKDYIHFIRKKTERMTTSVVTISVPLVPQVIEIINKWGTKNPTTGQYIFPLLNPLVNEDFGTIDPIQRNIRFKHVAYWLIKKEIRRLDRILLKIEKKINSPVHLSTNVARYSWVNFLDSKGAPLKLIQEGLGHTNPTTTLHYLENIRGKEANKYVDLLKAV